MKRITDAIRQVVAEWLMFVAAMTAPNTEMGDIMRAGAIDMLDRLIEAKEGRQ